MTWRMSIQLHSAIKKAAKSIIVLLRLAFWLAIYSILLFKKVLPNKTNGGVTELWFCDSSDSFKLANQACLTIGSAIVILDLGRRPRVSNQACAMDVYLFTYARLLFLLFVTRSVTVLCVPHLHPSLIDPEFSLVFMSLGKSHLVTYDDGMWLAIGVSPASKYIPFNLTVTRYGWDYSPLPVLSRPKYPLAYKLDAVKYLPSHATNRHLTTAHVISSRLLSSDLRRPIKEILMGPHDRCLYYRHPNPTKDLAIHKMPEGTSWIPPLRDLIGTLQSRLAPQDVIFTGYTSAALVLLSLKQNNKLYFSRLVLALDPPQTELERLELMRFVDLMSHQGDVVIL